MSKRVLHVVTTVDRSEGSGRWLPELAQAWGTFAEVGFEQVLVAPAGGGIDVGDAVEHAMLRTQLLRMATPAQIDAGDFDAIVFVDDAASAALASDAGLQRIAHSIVAHGGVLATLGDDADALAAICDDATRVLYGADVPAMVAARIGR